MSYETKTVWGCGEDNDGWYAGPPGEQIFFNLSEAEATLAAAYVNASRLNARIAELEKLVADVDDLRTKSLGYTKHD